MRASKEEGQVPPSSRAQRILTRVNPLFLSKAGHADDAVLYGVFKDCSDAESLLVQQDLNSLVH